MFNKINAVFRPNNGQRCRGAYKSEDYHNACTVKLVRSTSMLVVGETQQQISDSTLKRSKSSVDVESTTALQYYHRQDRIWLYSQNRDCLQYLEDLMALRRQYKNNVSHLNSKGRKATISSKKKSPPIPPSARREKTSKTKATAPPIPKEEDTLEFFDSVIASCDLEPKRKPNLDNGHADVDFIVATSTSEHGLHSNWLLRNPKRFSVDEDRLKRPEAQKSDRGSGSSSVGDRRQLQRNPIHLPKVVESALQTLRFKPKLRK